MLENCEKQQECTKTVTKFVQTCSLTQYLTLFRMVGPNEAGAMYFPDSKG
jgi:hypothetical protein